MKALAWAILPFLLQGTPASRPAPAAFPSPRPYSDAARLPKPAAGTFRVYVVRHAESVGNVTRDNPALSEADKDKLTDKGREQARALGACLARLGAGQMLHSPARRAVETAELAREAWRSAETRPASGPVRSPAPDLHVAPAFGPLVAGKAPRGDKTALQALLQAWREGNDLKLDGGESLAEVAERCKRGAQEMSRASAADPGGGPGSFVLVSHGEVLLAWLAAFDGRLLLEQMIRTLLPNAAFAAFDLGTEGTATLVGYFAPDDVAGRR